MITGSLDALPVRQTATTSGNASRRRVGRISVGLVLFGTVWWATPARAADDAKKDVGIRILPATKLHLSMAAPYEPPAPRRAGTPANVAPPLPAEPGPPTGRPEGPQLRIMPAYDNSAARNVQLFDRVYRSIPFSRSAYEADPMYRQEIALALLLNQFPPGF
jgi:hypothetical protein